MHVRNAPRLIWRKSWMAAAALQALMGLMGLMGLTGLTGSAQAGGVRWELAPVPVVAGMDLLSFATTAVNNAGQSVGSVKVNGVNRAFLNSGGSLLWLGNPLSGTEHSWQPSAISDPAGVRGTVHIAGNIFDCSTGHCVSPRNFVQTAGTVLGQLGSVQTLSFPGVTESRITAINQGGVVAGVSVIGGNRTAAFAGSLAEGFIPLQTLNSSDGHAWAINNAGIVAGWVGRTPPNEGAAIWNARTGSVQYIGALGGSSSQAFSVNEQGTVVGRASVGFINGVERSEAFIYRNGVMSPIATNLSSAGSGSVATSINKRGQTLGSFLATVNGVEVRHSFIHTASGGAVSLQGLGLQYPDGKMNDLGQILQSSTLHNPTGRLTWAQSTGGSVGVADNWDSGIGFAPNKFLDVVITTARDQTISGDASFVAKSLLIDGSASGQGTLALSNGAAVFALNGVTVGARGRLQGAGSVLGLGVINRGVVDALPGQLLVLEGGLDNRGVVTGNGRIEADLINRSSAAGGAGGVQVGAGQNLTLAGTVHSLSDGSRVRVRDGGSLALEGRVINQGGATIEIQRGVLQVGYGANRMQSAGLVLVGSGHAELLGDVTNGPRGLMHATEGADLTVWDGLVNDGEVRISGVARIVYAGAVSGKGNFTGLAGTHRFEGGYSPGASAATVQMGSVEFDSLVTMELGGLAPGSQHDRIVFGGSALFEAGSFLKVSLINGFVPSAGNTFALFGYAQAPVGNFEDFYLPGLGAGLSWDVSQVHTSGVLSVTAVPEPGSWGLMLFGLLGLVGLRRSVMC